MSIRITATRLSGGTSHEHIVHLWWTDPATNQPGNGSRSTVIYWMETKAGQAYVDDGRGNHVSVAVVTPSHGEKYLRTHADGVWTDNLLALPHR
jgi:hypothetical protein